MSEACYQLLSPNRRKADPVPKPKPTATDLAVRALVDAARACGCGDCSLCDALAAYDAVVQP